MSQNEIKKIIRFYIACLKEDGVKVSKAILFGSQAKGTSKKESDIDVVIVSNAFEHKDIFQRAEMIVNAEEKTMKKFVVPMDVILMTMREYNRKDSLTAAAAKEEGRLLYSA
jgi:predicted nucleotidyltransferase